MKTSARYFILWLGPGQMTSLTKKTKPKTKHVFRLSESFGGLNNSLARSAEELKTTEISLVFPQFPGTVYHTQTVKVLNSNFE